MPQAVDADHREGVDVGSADPELRALVGEELGCCCAYVEDKRAAVLTVDPNRRGEGEVIGIVHDTIARAVEQIETANSRQADLIVDHRDVELILTLREIERKIVTAILETVVAGNRIEVDDVIEAVSTSAAGQPIRIQPTRKNIRPGVSKEAIVTVTPADLVVTAAAVSNVVAALEMEVVVRIS